MRNYIGQIAEDFILKDMPAKFINDDYVQLTDGSGLIGRIVLHAMISQRAYGITYKYLILVDKDVYVVHEENLTLYSRG